VRQPVKKSNHEKSDLRQIGKTNQAFYSPENLYYRAGCSSFGQSPS
jgi:hypothetical protein